MMEEQRRYLLSNICTPEARERLARVAIVKPDNARAVEEYLIKLARSGKMGEKVTEDRLIRILEEVSGAVAGASGGAVASKVTIQRKKRRDEDDDDDDDDF
jgi:programmed cell death protein 5